MKKLLISTALVATMGFAAGAFAQTTPVVDASGNPLFTWTGINGEVLQGTNADYLNYLTSLSAPVAADYTGGATDPAYIADLAAYNDALSTTQTSVAVLTVGAGETNSLEGQQQSLLQSLLSQATDIQVSLANTSENLANIDGSVAVDLSRFESNLDVTVGVDGVTIMEPLNAKIGQINTTVIGSLGDGTVDTTSVLSNVEAVNQAMTASSDALNLQFGNAADNLGLQQVYNLSSNLGALDASVDVTMAGVNLDDLAGIATTAIGSLGTGAITADITNNAAGLTNRLVGTNP